MARCVILISLIKMKIKKYLGDRSNIQKTDLPHKIIQITEHKHK